MPDIELPTDEELQHWENLATTHVEGQPVPVAATEQGMAVAELARAIPRLLYLIRMERLDESLRLEAGEVEALRAEVERLTAVNRRIATSHANLTRGLQDRLDEGLAPLTKRIEAVRAFVNDSPVEPGPAGIRARYVPAAGVLRILDGE